jgi:hypothetical protein
MMDMLIQEKEGPEGLSKKTSDYGPNESQWYKIKIMFGLFVKRRKIHAATELLGFLLLYKKFLFRLR